jgi:transposase
MLRLFSVDLAASDTARLMGGSVRSANDIYLRLRQRLASECVRRIPIRTCDVEIEESYSGPCGVRGQWARGAGSTTIIFGVFKRDGRVYTGIVPECSAKTVLAVIRGTISPQVIVHSDGWRGYDRLVDVAATRSTCGSSTAGMSSRAVRGISMASRASGAMPSDGCIRSKG